MGDLLNPYQRTAVISTVREFEKSLREAIRWLDDASEDGILYKKSLELPAERRGDGEDWNRVRGNSQFSR